MESKVFYIYKITILKGSKKGCYYIGQHQTLNLNDGYCGSGVIISDWFKKKRIEGVDYKKDILCYCKDENELSLMESYFVADKYETDKLCLNQQGGGTCNYHNSSDTRKKKSKGLSKFCKENPDKVAERGRKYSEFIKSNPENKKQQILHLKEWYKENPDKVAEKGRKISKSNKGKESSFKGHTHTEEAKNIISIKTTESQEDAKWMTNGDENHFVHKENIQKYLDKGYIFGRIFSYKSEESRKEYGNKISKRQIGSRLMTNGIDKPKRIQKKYIEIKQKEGWYFCDNNGNKKVM